MLTKEELIKYIQNVLNAVSALLPDSPSCKKLVNLKEDINKDFYTIVVVGEFKRGKSTFINALLGQDLLPVDVIPTTATINVLVWSKEKNLIVSRFDNNKEEMALTNNTLKRFVVSDDFDPSEVKYLTLMLPSPVLENKLVIVDTPGVDDLNIQRSEITYSFIPRADAVIFMLDITTPVRRTEREFLSETILKEGINKIIFIANCFDKIDEDEENPDEIFNDLKKRVNSILLEQDNLIFPLSAKMALKGKLQNNQELIIKSGIVAIEDKIKELTQSGRVAKEKLSQFNNKFMVIINELHIELEESIQICNSDIEELSKQIRNIESVMVKSASRKQVLDNYTEIRGKEILAIIKKSLSKFNQSLTEDIENRIMQYNSPEIKDYVEHQIPVIVKRSIKNWYEQYSPLVKKLLQMYERNITIGLAKEFNTSVKGLSGYCSNILSRDSAIEECATGIESKDISKVPLTAGFITGGISIATIIVGMPVIMPLVSMAIYPHLQRTMLKKNLEETKASLVPQIHIYLDKIHDAMRENICGNVTTALLNINEAAINNFDENMAVLKKKVQQEIDRKKAASQKGKADVEKYQQVITLIETIQREVVQSV